MASKQSHPIHILTPCSFLNPTVRYHPIPATPAPDHPPEHTPSQNQHDKQRPPSAPGPEHGVYHIWRSRDNRKGRHAALVPRRPPAMEDTATATFPRATNSAAETFKGLIKMATRFPVWDVSYDVAVVFTLGELSLMPWISSGGWTGMSSVLGDGSWEFGSSRRQTGSLTPATGSVVWVINSFFVWLPLAAPWTEFPGESDIGGGWTAFIGATIFEFGSVLLMIEAVNENREYVSGEITGSIPDIYQKALASAGPSNRPSNWGPISTR